MSDQPINQKGSGDEKKDKKDVIEEIAISSSAFELLEREFQEVLAELSGDESLERFRLEYEKLHRALQTSHISEKRLIKKCTELNAEILANASKVQTALKLSQEDQNTIMSLKKEIEKAWKMVDASHEKEARAKETIQQLKKEIANLSQLVEQGAGLTVGQENTVKELLKVKEELTKERDTLSTQIVAITNDMNDLLEKIRKLEAEKQELDNEIVNYKSQINKKKADIDRETKRRERADKELKELRSVLEQRNAEIKAKQIQIQEGQAEIQRLEQALKEQNEKTNKAMKDHEALNQTTISLSKQLEESIKTCSHWMAENSAKKMELSLKEEAISNLRADLQKATKVKEGLLRKVRQLEEEKMEVEKSKEGLRGMISNLEREIEKLNKQSEWERKQIEDLTHQRDILEKKLRNEQIDTKKKGSLIKISDNHKKNLEREMQEYRKEAEKQRKEIYKLEKEREAYAAASAEATQKWYQALEEVKIKQMTIADYQKKIQDGEAKLKQQQQLYEAVRSDRNLYSKNLIEAQEEIAEMERKFKIMNHQIEQLKDEIAAKEKALVNEHFTVEKITKARENLQEEIQRLNHLIETAKKTNESNAAEIEKLNAIIDEAEQERQRQKKDYDNVMNDRDILGTQLIRRNDELALLYEKIRIQQSTLTKGEIQYRERLEDINLLKLKIQELRRKLHVYNKQVGQIGQLKADIHALQRELLQERTKVKALSEELENPMNVHRWRKLEGSDPGTYEMIQKIQTLQKRLIAKTEEVVEKDLLIQEKEKLYIELKNILARQPGPEVAEQLNVYQENLRKKTAQLKSLQAELNMSQTRVRDLKYDIERVQRELQDIRKKYFEEKKKNSILQQRQRAGSAGQSSAASSGMVTTMDSNASKYPLSHPQNQPRFVGGGFGLNQTQ